MKIVKFFLIIIKNLRRIFSHLQKNWIEKFSGAFSFWKDVFNYKISSLLFSHDIILFTT